MLTKQLRLKLRLSPTGFIVAGLLLLCIALFFWRLDAYSLFNSTEAKQAEIARQMWVRGNWITPFFNGQPYFDKPVLLHWLIALGFPVLGVGEWAVRLPSAIAATALILGTWFFVAYVTNRRMALFAATMLAANPFLLALGRTGQHDMLLTCFLAAALYCWYWSYSTSQRRGYLFFFALLALAVLAKGPIAVLLASLTISIFLLWIGQWQKILPAMPWGKGIILFGGITLPWHILVTQANGWNFINQFFLFNNASRFVSVNQNQTGPWYYYLLCLLVGFFPWIVMLPTVLTRTSRQWFQFSYWRRQSAAQQLSLFMAIWFGTVLIFMSVSATKLPWYIAPGLPALAYLCAQAWDRQIRAPNRQLKLGLGLVSGSFALLAVGFISIPRLIPQPVLQSVEVTQVLWLWACLYGAAALVIGISLVHPRGRAIPLMSVSAETPMKQKSQVFWTWAASLLAFGLLALTAINQLMPVLDKQVLDGRLLPIAQALRQETSEVSSNDLPATLGVYAPSLNFYSKLSDIALFNTSAQVQAQLTRPQRLLLVTTDANLADTGLDLSRYQPAYVYGDFKLFIIPEQPLKRS